MSLPTPVIIGIVVGAVMCLSIPICICVMCICMCRRREVAIQQQTGVSVAQSTPGAYNPSVVNVGVAPTGAYSYNPGYGYSPNTAGGQYPPPGYAYPVPTYAVVPPTQAGQSNENINVPIQRFN